VPLAEKGFTLVELLVVVGLIGLLAFALLGNIGSSTEAANSNRCRNLINQLAFAAENYMAQPRYGDYPPDDFRPLRDPIQVKIDAINTGIESFLIYVNREGSRDEGFGDEEMFCNTDGDSNKTPLGRYGHSEKYEVMDPWGSPIVYFHNRGYRKIQNYKMYGDENTEGETVDVHAYKRPNGTFLNPRSFQFFSAGPDGEFYTADDIGNFKIQNNN